MKRNLGDIPQNLRPDRPAREGSNEDRFVKRDTMIVMRASVSVQLSIVKDRSVQPILNQNHKRNYLLVQNNGLTDVFINFGNKATLGSIRIIAGGNFEPIAVPINSVYLVSNAGDRNACSIAEGVEI